VERRRKEIEKSVERYLQQLDTADRQEPSMAGTMKKQRLTDKLAMLKVKMTELEALEAEMLAAPDQQISLTDPDARSMATKAQGSGVVGYNVQTAVDSTHHLIVAHDVINEGNDRSQLSPMSKKAKAALGTDKLEVLADSGYFSGEEILECGKAGITVALAKPLTSGNRLKNMFVKEDFRYVANDDVYICPAGERLVHHFTNVEKGMTLRRYWTNACRTCAMKDRCTTGKERRITRWEHEHVVEAVERRLDENPWMMHARRNTVEHPFGTIKSWMGHTHFQMRTLKKVATEMALHVLAYNLKRVMNILGIGPLIAAIRAA
jgi:transposase